MDTVSSASDVGTQGPTIDARGQARKRLEQRRDFMSHLVAYVVINAFLIGVWALTGGYFWPAWILGLWGAGLVMHAWQTFMQQPITEADVDAELQRQR
jgi:uncharacterized membrane protein YecN with MAPEG domain